MADEDRSTDEESERLVPLERLSPLSIDEALSIIGEPTRASIIVALGEARSSAGTGPATLRYAELMARVGVEDSGRFHYHLDQLTGAFVSKREGGYALRYPGQLVYEAIVSGTLTARETIEPFPVGACPRCDGTLTAAYHADHLLTVECTGCETLYDVAHFPARGLGERTPRELLEAAYQRRFHKVATMRRGICPSCGSVVERDLRESADTAYGTKSVEEMAGLEVYAVLECGGCHSRLVGHPTNVALTTPAVVGFFDDHAMDVARVPWWEDAIVDARAGLVVLDERPTAVRIPFDLADERLTITVDADLQVTDSSRAPL